jgi:cardiolipin synthase
MIGTANMDVRSLFLDYEIAALFYDKESIQQVEGWTRETLQDCRRGVLDVSMARRLFEGVMHIIAPVV